MIIVHHKLAVQLDACHWHLILHIAALQGIYTQKDWRLLLKP
jgi:hypothetical protein